MSDDIIANLGPLAPLAGVWESENGIDTSRVHSEEKITKFKEKITFEPLGPVNNGPQALYGLRYSTVCWRLGEDDPFHEELGYWLWDKDRNQVMRCFMVPRGVLIHAGGYVKEDANSFHLEAELGSQTYGVLSNRYLDDSYKTFGSTTNFVIAALLLLVSISAIYFFWIWSLRKKNLKDKEVD